MDLNVRQGRRDEDVRIGISIAVRIRRQFVRQQIFAYCNELSDGFAVISRNSKCEILWSLDTAGCGLNG